MTRKALLITGDEDLKKYIEISALTLTKLNCQTEIVYTVDFDEAINISKEDNLDLILIDLELNNFPPLGLIKKISTGIKSQNKKLIGFSDNINVLNREEVFRNGCGSIMSKEELKNVINNLLQF
jgi:DNA-binding NarL/FixJ family response regulator